MEKIWLAFSAAFSAGILIGYLTGKNKSGKLKEKAEEKVKEGYLKGLHHMIAGQPNQAISEFSKTAALSSATPEIYLKLGDLFREKGDIERAIRLHQGVKVRTNLSSEVRILALVGLGRDYFSGGFIDRAVNSFKEILKTDKENQEALFGLGAIYLEGCDWESAYKIYTRLSKQNTSHKSNRILTNIQIEIGRRYLNNNENKKALKCFKQALEHNPKSARANLLLGDLWLKERQVEKALGIWSEQLKKNLPFARLIYPRLEKGLIAAGRESEIEGFYLKQIELHHSLKHPRYFLAGYYYRNQQIDQALKHLDDLLKEEPHFIPARQLAIKIIADKCQQDRNPLFSECLDLLLFPIEEQEVFVCSKCGYASADFPWRCPQCQRWDSFVEDYP